MISVGSEAGNISISYPRTLHCGCPSLFQERALLSPSSVTQVTKAVTGV